MRMLMMPNSRGKLINCFTLIIGMTVCLILEILMPRVAAQLNEDNLNSVKNRLYRGWTKTYTVYTKSKKSWEQSKILTPLKQLHIFFVNFFFAHLMI